MTKNLRIISIPLRAVEVNEKFTVTIRVAKELRVEYVKFLYCQKDNWFDTTIVPLKRQEKEEEKYDYFSSEVSFSETYSHFCHFQMKTKGEREEKVIKRNRETNEPYISSNGEGYHWDIHVFERIGKSKEKKYLEINFKTQKNEIYCDCLEKRAKIPKDRIRQEVLSIMGELFQISKNFLISYDENMEADKKEMIQDALYEERMYFEIEGIVVKEK